MPEWKSCKATGKWERGKTGGGIDQFRFARPILEDHLLPFAREHKEKWPETLVVEDGASPHKHGFHQDKYSYYETRKMFWAGNSPQHNMIKPVWGDVKREMAKGGSIHKKEEPVKGWERAQNFMRQKMLRARVHHIRHHLVEIVRHEGGNQYLEGNKRFLSEDNIPLQLPITLPDSQFQYYNLSALNSYGDETEHRWKDFQPASEREDEEEKSLDEAEDVEEEEMGMSNDESMTSEETKHELEEYDEMDLVDEEQNRGKQEKMEK